MYVNCTTEIIGLFIRADGNRYEGEWRKDLKHGNGMFFHLNSGQVQDGVWNNDMCVYSQLKDVDYRQCCIEPTPYPIPEVRSFIETKALSFAMKVHFYHSFYPRRSL